MGVDNTKIRHLWIGARKHIASTSTNIVVSGAFNELLLALFDTSAVAGAAAGALSDAFAGTLTDAEAVAGAGGLVLLEHPEDRGRVPYASIWATELVLA